MDVVTVNARKPEGWSLVAGKFHGTDKTYFYVIRGRLMCDPPLRLQCPAAEDGFVYSNPFTIGYVLAYFGPHIDQEAMLKLGRYLPAQRDLRILVGDELQNGTTSHPWNDIVCVKNTPKLKQAVADWEATLIGEAEKNKTIVKNIGGIETMGTNCNCKNENTGALGEVLFFWHDEVYDRIGELIGLEVSAVREASTKKAFVEQMAARIAEFERQGGEVTVDSETKVEKRMGALCSLLMNWVEVPKVEADQILALDRIRKDALARLEEEFESLIVRSKVVRPGDEVEWLRTVGVYREDEFDFDIEDDARRLIYTTAGQFHFITEI